MNEVVKRTLSGIIYIALLIGAILFSETTFLILFSVFYILSVYEFCRLYSIPITKGLSVSVLMAGLAAFLHNTDFNSTYLLVLPFSIYLIADLFRNSTHGKPSPLKKYMHLTGYVVIPFFIIAQLPYLHKQYTPLLLLSIFIMIWCNDTFAYICGKLFGKHKLYEKISPKKTIEGFIGGLLFTQIAAFLISSYMEIGASLAFWMCTASGISIIGTIGDLIESRYKRQAGVKDSGSVMPGHGGILDRLDSILFAAPFIFLIYKLII